MQQQQPHPKDEGEDGAVDGVRWSVCTYVSTRSCRWSIELPAEADHHYMHFQLDTWIYMHADILYEIKVSTTRRIYYVNLISDQLDSNTIYV